MWAEKHGSVWRIRDLVAGKKVTLETGWPNKTTAKNRIIELLNDKLKGDFIDPRVGQVLLSTWIEKWWPSYEPTLKPSTRISTLGLLSRYILPGLGEVALDDITPLTIQTWVAGMLAGTHRGARGRLSVKTVRNAHGLLHKILREAVRERMIRTNPAVGTRFPVHTRHEMRFLTEPEARRLLNTVPDHWRPLVLVLLGTGLRFGEAIGLRVGRVDLVKRRLEVAETMQELATTGEVVFVSPKSKMSRRMVSFTPAVAAALTPLMAGKKPDVLVFAAVQGGVVRYGVFRKMWTRTIKRADLVGLRIHDLRHTHIAWLISDGHPLTAISRRVGHASISVTSDRYGHLLPQVDEGILDTVDRALPGGGGGGILGEMKWIEDGATRNNKEEPAGQDG